MKKIITIGLVLFLGAGTLQAQVVKKAGHEIKKGAQKTGHAVKKGAKKVGNETAELASKGKAKVTDKKLDNKTGPNNETIYINDEGRYYWIDKHGKKHFIAASALKTKVQ